MTMTNEVEIHGVRMRPEVYDRIKGGVPPDYTEEEFSAYSAIALAKERAAAAGPKMEGATCRGCRRPLFGKDYCYGGRAYVPDANGNFTYREAKKNYYGGFVCSRECDFRSSLALEQDMPGHGYSQKSLGQSAQRSLEANWDSRN